MLLTLDDRQLAEILVQGHEDTNFGVCASEGFYIARISAPLCNANDVMACGLDTRLSSTPDTRIEEHPHYADLVIRGSTRSWATSRRAYSIHAKTSSRSSQS
jgi:hypothetical protein